MRIIVLPFPDHKKKEKKNTKSNASISIFSIIFSHTRGEVKLKQDEIKSTIIKFHHQLRIIFYQLITHEKPKTKTSIPFLSLHSSPSNWAKIKPKQNQIEPLLTPIIIEWELLVLPVPNPPPKSKLQFPPFPAFPPPPNRDKTKPTQNQSNQIKHRSPCFPKSFMRNGWEGTSR